MLQRDILAHYCESNILDIPKALFNIGDVKPILFHDESAIFFKDLEKDLVNIEFHTSAPCLVYIETGREIITSCHNKSFDLRPGEAILLPKGLNLHSDYTHEGNGLNAYLAFFGADVLSQFLSAEYSGFSPLTNEQAILKLKANAAVKEYFASLQSVYEPLDNNPRLLGLKLLELLYLLDINDDGRLRKSLLAIQKDRAKRNIKRLMEQFALSDLSTKEIAELSGRSASTFNREFKAIYNTTPKQWLIKRRLAHAHALLSEQNCSVTTAATEAGYSNISHFINAFRKRYGKTPHQVKPQS
jgi:AraC-like DNA-binding protein/nitrite reductase/ring-hydroxylating ferredoxin subunit